MNSTNSSPTNEFVSIVILNYNDTEHIEKCIDSVFKTIGCKFEVILIDNGSTDGSSDICKQKYSQIRLFKNKHNLAMAARNIGIDNAQGDFIVFLDSDTTVESDWLQNLLESYFSHGEGLYQSKILKQNDPETIVNSGSFMNIFGFGYASNYGMKDTKSTEKFRSTSFTVGACLFSSLETIKKIGYFDDSNLLFLMMDDVDYSWKALTLGILSYYEPNSIIYHPEGTSSKLNSKTRFLLERNRWICLLSFYERKTLLKISPINFLLEFALFFYFLIHGHGYAKIKSSFSILKLLPAINKRRKKIATNRKFSDKQVISNFVDDFILPKSLSGTSSTTFYHFFMRNLNKIARKTINF